jgi:hypothetical protein
LSNCDDLGAKKTDCVDPYSLVDRENVPCGGGCRARLRAPHADPLGVGNCEMMAP